MKMLLITLSLYVASALLLFASLPSKANINDIDIYAKSINDLSQRIESIAKYRDVKELRDLCNKAHMFLYWGMKTEAIMILAYLEQKLKELEAGKINV